MRLRAGLGVLIGAILGSCGEGSRDAAVAASERERAEAPRGPHRIVVFATMSLKAAFEELERGYEADHPGAEVELRCDGGAALLQAMNEGAPCDVVAIGDNSLMSRFAAGVHLSSGAAHELARNRIAIAVAPGNPKRIAELADLTREDLRVALGTASSSIGRHARWALSKQRLAPEAVALAPHADGVLALVASGDADAGVVYATSFAGQSGVERIEVPEEENTPVLYSIAIARRAQEPRGARAFVDRALAASGQAALRTAGFLPIGAK